VCRRNGFQRGQVCYPGREACYDKKARACGAAVRFFSFGFSHTLLCKTCGENREVNQKLQTMLEETLMKNIQLQKMVETLSGKTPEEEDQTSM
jgi:hypothetical protein